MSNFINADLKIDKFNEIIDIAKRTASDLKPASYRGSLRAEGKPMVFIALDKFFPLSSMPFSRILQFLSSILALIIAFLREKRYIMIKERIELVERG